MQIIGHEQITKYLQQSLTSGKLAHAYLFYGPKQLGKDMTAKWFAKSLLCHEHHKTNSKNIPKVIPCNTCQHCQEFDKRIHPDVYQISKGKEEKNISIEQIRELKEKLSKKSFFNSYKIVIISGAETMSIAAANGLLKTLEEPLGKTLIILTAEKIHAIPQTIISRTQKIKFNQVKQEEIYNYLVKDRKYDRDRSAYISALSQGRPGRAIIFANSSTLWQQYIASLNFFFSLLKAPLHEKISFSENLIGQTKGQQAKSNTLLPLLNLWQIILRDILLIKLAQNDKIVNRRVATELASLAPFFAIDKICLLTKQIDLLKRNIKRNINPKLGLENLLLNF